MKLKNKFVKIDKLHPRLKYILENIEKWIQDIEGKNYIMTITSGNDGIHMPKSLHYKNRAIDIRTKDMYLPNTVKIKLQLKLGKDYDVILEKNHIHIEYQPKN